MTLHARPSGINCRWQRQWAYKVAILPHSGTDAFRASAATDVVIESGRGGGTCSSRQRRLKIIAVQAFPVWGNHYLRAKRARSGVWTLPIQLPPQSEHPRAPGEKRIKPQRSSSETSEGQASIADQRIPRPDHEVSEECPQESTIAGREIVRWWCSPAPPFTAAGVAGRTRNRLETICRAPMPSYG